MIMHSIVQEVINFQSTITISLLYNFLIRPAEIMHQIFISILFRITLKIVSSCLFLCQNLLIIFIILNFIDVLLQNNFLHLCNQKLQHYL